MHTPIDMQAVADRVLGLSMPRVPMAARLPRPWDSKMGVVLMVISALVTAGCLALWMEGQPANALRLFGASVIVLSLAVRLL